MSAGSSDCSEVQAEYDGLIYAISHDLRAPARAITGFAQVLRELLETQAQGALQGDAQRFMERIESSTQRLHQMLDGLLTLSRLSQQPMHLQATTLKPLCQRVIELLPAQRQQLVMLDMRDEVHAVADVALITIAVSALLDNANKFCNATVAPAIHIEGSCTDAYTLLTVSDNGPGFDMQYAHRLGIPFQHLHAHSALQGIGIGLASVRRIMARHGGTLRVEAELGKGSKFHLQWPHLPVASSDNINKT
jgi:signal transduction histidine kinase